MHVHGFVNSVRYREEMEGSLRHSAVGRLLRYVERFALSQVQDLIMTPTGECHLKIYSSLGFDPVAVFPPCSIWQHGLTVLSPTAQAACGDVDLCLSACCFGASRFYMWAWSAASHGALSCHTCPHIHCSSQSPPDSPLPSPMSFLSWPVEGLRSTTPNCKVRFILCHQPKMQLMQCKYVYFILWSINEPLTLSLELADVGIRENAVMTTCVQWSFTCWLFKVAFLSFCFCFGGCHCLMYWHLSFYMCVYRLDSHVGYYRQNLI